MSDRNGSLQQAPSGYRISRRGFLKASAALGAAAGVAGMGTRTKILRALETKAAAAPAPAEEKLYYSVCAPNCWMGCRLYAHVRDGKLVKTSLAPMPDPRYNRICLRGLSHVQRVYHPDRLKYPLKRVGKRGEGKWERISWEEAIDTIARRFDEVRKKYGSRAVAFMPMSGNYGVINGGLAGAIMRFANLFEGTLVTGAIDSALQLGLQQVLATAAGYYGGFFAGNEPLDMSNSRLIIAWGTNLTESQVHNWHFIADARDRGAKLIVIDPNFTVLAAKADLWIPLRPGSDPALGMAVLHVLINEGLYDEDFVLRHTVGPFLVRGDNGRFLREQDVVPGGSDRYMVWDPVAGAARPFDQVSRPALTGQYRVGDLQVKPAFQLLAERVAEFSPEKTQQITDVAPETVRTLAREYATRKPAFIYPSMGVDRYDNSHLVGRALGTMAALTGNIGMSGATPCGTAGGGALTVVLDPRSVGGWLMPTGTYATPLNYLLAYDAITQGKVRMYVPADPKNPALGTSGPDPVEVPYTIKAAFINTSNFVSSFPNQRRIIDELFAEDKLEFVVVADLFMTDTAQYADILLPVTHWFENDDIVGGIHPFFLIQQKALPNPWECKSDFEIFQMLARKMGYGEYFQGTAKDYIDPILNEIARNLGSEGDKAIEQFRKEGAVRFFPAPYYSFADRKFWTYSGRMEFYAEKELVNFPSTVPLLGIPVEKGGDPLPRWEPPVEAWSTSEEAKKYPLVCMQEHTRWRVHSTYYNQPWLRELDPEPEVKLNPADARERGIRDGDYVEVFNDRGRMVARAVVSPAVRPGMVNIPKGWQRSQTRAGGYQELTKDHQNRFTLNCSFFDTRVEVRKAPV